jgi:phosphoheptose isomerase
MTDRNFADGKKTEKTQQATDPARRRLLMRMGLAASAIYAAPVLMQLSGARASSFSVSSFSAPARQARPAPPPPRPEILVAAPQPSDVDLIAQQGYTLLDRSPLGIVDFELARFSVPANITIDQAQAQILQTVPGALFDLNHVYEPGELACDTDGCAAFDLVGWTPETRACPSGAVIGMIDTTVNREHAALDGVDVEKVAIIGEGREAASAVHGTAIAILLAGREDTRTPGLLSGVRLVAAEAFHRGGNGNDMADAFDIARAIDRLVNEDVTVINLSFAGPRNGVLEAVVNAARERDILLVAAAGNAGPQSEPLYPAAYDGVLAVTAVDRENRIYRRAVNGAHIDFAGPGVNLWTAASVSGGRFRSGTSYAAPFVSAALAVARAENPDMPGEELVQAFADSAIDLGEDGRDPVFGWGLVQSPQGCTTGASVIR